MIGFARTLVIVLWLGHATAFAQTGELPATPTDLPGLSDIPPYSLARVEGLRKDFDRPIKRTFALELGPRLIELKGFYLEKRRHDDAHAELQIPQSPQWGGYFDLGAVSSQLGGKLVGETELAYSQLGFSGTPSAQPLMTRIGLKGNWSRVGYGVSYRSFGSGFVSTTGAKVEHARDEDQLWAEYDFGGVRLRGAAGETSEENSQTNQITVTRTAATSIALNRSRWQASISSAYSALEAEPALDQKSFAWNNALAFVFRPATSLTLEPNLGFKQEWNRDTGLKTDTASAAVSWSCAPSRAFRLVGRTFFSLTTGDDQAKQGTFLNTTAGLDWRIGKTFLGEPSVSLRIGYTNELRPDTPEHSQRRFTGMIRFELAKF